VFSGLSQTCTWWYNRKNNRRGSFWSERFKSVLIQSGESLLNCLGYIDLKPVRAGIVQRPEDYRWCSLAYRVQQGNKDGFLSFSGLFDLDHEYLVQGPVTDHDETQKEKKVKVNQKEAEKEKERLRKYRAFVYEVGSEIEKPGQAKIAESIRKIEEFRDYQLPQSEIFLYRCRYFSDSLVLGSKSFVQDAYNRFAGVVFYKKERRGHATGISKGIFSLRQLRSISP